MISGVLLFIVLLSVLLPTGCGVFTLMFVLQHKRLQRIRQRRRMFRRVSSLCEEQRKKVVADVLLNEVCPLYIYEGYVVDGISSTVDQSEEFYIEGTVNDSVKSPSQVWQNPNLSAVRERESYASPSRKLSSNFIESLSSLDIGRKSRDVQVERYPETLPEEKQGDTEVVMTCGHSSRSESRNQLLSNSFVHSEEKLTCIGTDECSICLDSIRVGDYMRKLPCGHLFHATCVERWLLHAHRCPLCNKDLVSCLNGNVPIEDDHWLNSFAQNERRRRPGWNRPFAHIRYLFQEYPFEWNRVQLFFENNRHPSEITEDNI